MEINPDAIFIAEALDFERKTAGSRGLLHGIPVLLKDNIETNDKMRTSAGALALENHIFKRFVSCTEVKRSGRCYSRKDEYDRMG